MGGGGCVHQETPPRTPIDKGNVMILFYIGAVHMIFMLKSKKKSKIKESRIFVQTMH